MNTYTKHLYALKPIKIICFCVLFGVYSLIL